MYRTFVLRKVKPDSGPRQRWAVLSIRKDSQQANLYDYQENENLLIQHGMFS